MPSSEEHPTTSSPEKDDLFGSPQNTERSSRKTVTFEDSSLTSSENEVETSLSYSDMPSSEEHATSSPEKNDLPTYSEGNESSGGTTITCTETSLTSQTEVETSDSLVSYSILRSSEEHRTTSPQNTERIGRKTVTFEDTSLTSETEMKSPNSPLSNSNLSTSEENLPVSVPDDEGTGGMLVTFEETTLISESEIKITESMLAYSSVPCLLEEDYAVSSQSITSSGLTTADEPDLISQKEEEKRVSVETNSSPKEQDPATDQLDKSNSKDIEQQIQVTEYVTETKAETADSHSVSSSLKNDFSLSQVVIKDKHKKPSGQKLLSSKDLLSEFKLVPLSKKGLMYRSKEGLHKSGPADKKDIMGMNLLGGMQCKHTKAIKIPDSLRRRVSSELNAEKD